MYYDNDLNADLDAVQFLQQEFKRSGIIGAYREHWKWKPQKEIYNKKLFLDLVLWGLRYK